MAASLFSSPTLWTSAEPFPGIGTWQVGDFNGDGQDDILREVTSTTGADVFLSSGSSFAYAGDWKPASYGVDGWHVGDFNGDGRADVFRQFLDGPSDNSSSIEVELSDGTKFNLTGFWLGRSRGTDDHGNRDSWTVGDFNGDGRDDIFRYVVGSSGADMYLSTGSNSGPGQIGVTTGFVPAGSWTPAGNGLDNQWHVGDFNGDGKDDLLRALVTGVDVFLSNGNSFVHSGLWSNAVQGIDDQGQPAPWSVGDVNGDGRADILRYISGVGTEAFLSDGTKFVSNGIWTPAGIGNDNQWHVGDFNGDGANDLARTLAGHGTDVLLAV